MSVYFCIATMSKNDHSQVLMPKFGISQRRHGTHSALSVFYIMSKCISFW